MRRFLAVTLALCILTSGISGCSQPIDTGSTVPAASQPIVALLALVAVGIGLTAWHHHNEDHHGSGPSSTIVAPFQVIGPQLSGYRASDLSIDTFDNGVGVLETPTVSGTPARFGLIASSTFASFTLPNGYVPIALATDPSGNDWFVDTGGHIQGCEPPGVSVTSCVFSSLAVSTANDGLGAGPRSIATDGLNLVVIRDGGSGKVNWFVINLTSAATATGSYQSNSSAALYPADAVESTPPGTGSSAFAVFHTDGRSDLFTPAPSNAPNFSFVPIPDAAPSDQVVALDGNPAFYATTGSTSGTYQLTRYENPSTTGIGQLTTASITIAANGQTGAPQSKPYALPLSSVHVDSLNNVWALDGNTSNPNIVQFASF